MEYVGIFLAGFASVFLLGFQSRNVNHGNFGWAAGTSFAVAISQGMLWSHIIRPDIGFLGWLTYGFAGSSAIVSSMHIHKKYIQGGYTQGRNVR